jgi:hypothetical protein
MARKMAVPERPVIDRAKAVVAFTEGRDLVAFLRFEHRTGGVD